MSKEETNRSIFFYPAVFTPEEEGGFMVQFPDLPDIITCGDNEIDAIEMAQEALGTWLEDTENPPAASPITDHKAPEGGFISFVSVNMLRFLEKYGTQKAVKKTLTIPKWLDNAAREQNINFSQTLQDALKEKLGA